jgi:polynucleotide 5'-hydroxyl-kinase GRC3/NOL9
VSTAEIDVPGDWADEIDIPGEWAEAVRRILDGPARRVAVLGPADAGKSAFCAALLRGAEAAGRPVALLDADLGQKIAGPPACVTLRPPGPGGAARGAGAELAFVGALDPLRGRARLVAGVARLAGRARPQDLVVANTGGLLAGAGRRLKAAKLAAMGADLLVAVGADPALDAVLADHAAVPALRLAPSPRARRKTAAERRAVRREAFRRHFAGAGVWTAGAGELWVEDAAGAGRSAPPPERLLLGLADASGRDLALGILAGADAAGAVAVLAPVGRAAVAGLRLGLVRLDAAFDTLRPGP